MESNTHESTSLMLRSFFSVFHSPPLQDTAFQHTHSTTKVTHTHPTIKATEQEKPTHLIPKCLLLHFFLFCFHPPPLQDTAFQHTHSTSRVTHMPPTIIILSTVSLLSAIPIIRLLTPNKFSTSNTFLRALFNELR